MTNSSIDLTNIRKYLEAEKKRLEQRITELSAQDPFSDADRANDNAAIDLEASEESGHDRMSALVDQLTIELSDVSDALIRMDEGRYGICTGCGQSIEVGRITAMPTATLCISCENRQ